MAELAMTSRAIEPGDEAFLFEVFVSTREEELAGADWSFVQMDAFLRMQFTAQDRSYREHYQDADLRILEVDGQPAGRPYVHRRADEIRVMDIALLPAFRGRGFGTSLLLGGMEEAARDGKTVSVHVESSNRARHLYERLGFRKQGDDGMYSLMEWAPVAVANLDNLT